MAPIIRADGSVFLIDRTEVTFGQYAEFLRTPQGSSNSTVCPEGDSAVVPPECAAMPSDDADDDPSELPRVCVDWCGADAYCKWAGKELCADATQGTESALQAKSDFYAACSSGGSRYGCSGCQAPQCNGIDAHFGKVEPVGALPECTIGAAGCEVSDLSGNVAEWTAICTPATPTGSCATRGGSYQSSESELACSALGSLPRRHMSVTVGFRCCIHDWPR
jgi:formylglycine-generating enzyme required for sulfatase activity